VVDAGLKLRMIKHQIWSSKDVPDPPFPDHRELTYLFESLYHYTDWVIADFVQAKKPLLSAQRRVDHANLESETGKEPTEHVAMWDPTRPRSVDDMVVGKDLQEHEACRAQVERELKCAVPSDGDIDEPVGPWTWLRYEETEGLALARITRSTLGHRRERWLKRLRSKQEPPPVPPGDQCQNT
jgi:hypothetical protein